MSFGAPPGSQKRSFLLLLGGGILLVLMPVLFWHDTWFGRKLTDQDVSKYLQDREHPRKIQHALSQISDRIVQGDSTVQVWYPQIAELAQHPEGIIRTTAAWVMGQDGKTERFHLALLYLLSDPELMVRRNAALALVRFHDSSGRPEMLKMLQPYAIAAPAEGTVSIKSQPGEQVGSGSLLLRIKSDQGKEVEVRSPFAGQIDRILPKEGARVAAGEPVAAVNPGSDQVAEALRGLYLVGLPEDLPEVERCGGAGSSMPDRVRQQAVITAQAIRTRAEQSPSR